MFYWSYASSIDVYQKPWHIYGEPSANQCKQILCHLYIYLHSSLFPDVWQEIKIMKYMYIKHVQHYVECKM